ncbi:MAG: hypothetical protein Q4B01_05100 [Eubacteriales bacterium]|nr:hypothetical protein [Eubacteriales bacterium]
MAEFDITISQIRQAANLQEQAARRIASQSERIASVARGLSIEGASRFTLKATLRTLAEENTENANKIILASQALTKSAGLYQQAESKITGRQWNSMIDAVNAGKGAVKNTAGKSKSKENPFKWKWKDTAKIIGGFGPAGGIIAAGMNIATGESWTTTMKTIVSTIGGGAGVVVEINKCNVNWWKHVIGINTNTVEGSNFFSRLASSWGKEVSKLDMTGAKTTAEKIKVGAKWAGHVLTVASNGIENYNEFKGQKGKVGRAIGETVIESAVDIGLGMAASAAAGALLVGAPAFVVAGVGVAAVWAANGVCKWATGGRDIGEVTADLVMDFGEKGVSAAKSAYSSAKKSVGKAYQKTKQGVRTTWNKMTSWTRRNPLFA